MALPAARGIRLYAHRALGSGRYPLLSLMRNFGIEYMPVLHPIIDHILNSST